MDYQTQARRTRRDSHDRYAPYVVRSGYRAEPPSEPADNVLAGAMALVAIGVLLALAYLGGQHLLGFFVDPPWTGWPI